jgi:hypothetical protein
LISFDRYIAIDYSAAQTPISSSKGLRVYQAENATALQEVLLLPTPRRY